MKTSSLSELKKELQTRPVEEVVEYCIRLAKYKKENKELLTYLLFEAFDEDYFVREVKALIDVQFNDMNKSSLFLAKKTIRKVLRTTNKYIKFCNSQKAELELNIYFTQKLKDSGLDFQQSKVLMNIYSRQLQKIKKVLNLLHEDLQFDYKEEIEELQDIMIN